MLPTSLAAACVNHSIQVGTRNIHVPLLYSLNQDVNLVSNHRNWARTPHPSYPNIPFTTPETIAFINHKVFESRTQYK
jgi:hypothetical protein